MSNQFVPDPRYQQAQEPTQPQPAAYNERQMYAREDGGDRYVESRRENYVSPTGSQVERREEIYDDPNLRRANERYWVASVIYFVLCVLEILLALRFIFRLLGASMYNGFVSALYSISYVFAAPFKGIFTDPAFGMSHVFEVSTLIAMLIYALIAWGLVALARVVFGPTLTSRRRMIMQRQRREG